ncbi:hypothetical protein HC757_17445 [Shewanella sp. SHSM-M6]|uniref:Spondin domain-containing protein n=2 Tax=Shewanella salipaludis TaxID=2723052 RepID=A0A972G9C0_9GAMM|nr:hypothetical protein [Shewanella salipaludis]
MIKLGLGSLLMAAVLGLGACSDEKPPSQAPIPSNAPVPRLYSVTVTNLTANQPLSPMAVIAHSADMSLFRVTEPASVALEKLAEGGDTTGLVALFGVSHLARGIEAIPPGMSDTVSLSIPTPLVAGLSVATMLVNTNDAFATVNGYDLRSLALGDEVDLYALAYDAGTEANSEARGTMPGPADNGEGFNAARDDVNRVHIHPGVISADDGLGDSVLSASHRFNNPVAKIKIHRSR